ncbi:MAG TPA: hypothetical protein VFD39_02375, partial [Trueperaceae bacterium]|nr:hypothetical protein [Trueperaceae bacterium]
MMIPNAKLTDSPVHHRRAARLLAGLLLMAVGATATAQTPALAVSPQQLVDGALSIDALTLAEDGFVVVHAFDEAGDLVLTPPLGLVFLEAGEHADVVVALDQALLDQYGYGETAKDVLPMLHIDANDNTTYEFPEGPDVPVMVDDAMVVAALPLTVSGAMGAMDHGHGAGLTPALLATSQTAPATFAFSLDTVTLAEDGFVVVHAFDTAGELVLTPPLGLIYLQAGTHEDVGIGLDAGLLAQYGYGSSAKDVLPMVHVDANGNTAYEFPDGPDVPVMVDGAMVVATV